MDEAIERGGRSSEPVWTKADLAVVGIAALGFYLVLTNLSIVLLDSSRSFMFTLRWVIQLCSTRAASVTEWNIRSAAFGLDRVVGILAGLALTQWPRATRRLLFRKSTDVEEPGGVSEQGLRGAAICLIQIMAAFQGMAWFRSLVDVLRRDALDRWLSSGPEMVGTSLVFILCFICFICARGLAELMGLERGER